MKSKSKMTTGERRDRSRIAKILHSQSFIAGSLVEMKRKCGKPNCKCNDGELHASFYLAARFNGKRKMIYVPKWLEKRVEEQVNAYQTVMTLMQSVSDQNVMALLKEKKIGQSGENSKSKPAKKRGTKK